MGKIGRRALNVRAMSWPGMRAVIIYQQSGSHHQEFALCSQNEKPSIGSDWMYGASFIRCTLWLPLNNNNNRRKKTDTLFGLFSKLFFCHMSTLHEENFSDELPAVMERRFLIVQ